MTEKRKGFSFALKTVVESDGEGGAKSRVQASQPPIFAVTALWAAIIITVTGIAVFWSGLTGPFMGDDLSQIVTNPTIHSISNIRLFFAGTTFYNGQGIAAATGGYYRPLMETVYSLLYSVFGANVFAYHLTQLLLHILCAFMVFLIFRYFLRPTIALALSLIFLIHPVNSQAVYSISALQEPLFLLFGLLGLWSLIRFKYSSMLWLTLAAGCLLLSLLGKESGVLFVVISLIYAFLADRKRFYPLIGIAIGLVGVYLLMRSHVISIGQNPGNGPIDSLGLGGRLLNAPTLIFFYLLRFVFPLDLAHAYYWANTTITITNFVLPLIADTVAIGVIVYLGYLVLRRSDDRHFRLYIFFSSWAALGLLLHLQIIPLDLTASETWFYFPIIGLLGLIGTLLDTFPLRLSSRWTLAVVGAIILLLGSRTFIRGFDYSSQYNLASKDIKVSPQDYTSDNQIAIQLAQEGELEEAKVYAERSVGIYANSNYDTLGRILLASGDFAGADRAYSIALANRDLYTIYEDKGQLTLYYGSFEDNENFLMSSLKKLPNDGLLWFYLAILEQRNGNNATAKDYILRAQDNGQFNQYIYNQIMDNANIVVTLNKNIN